MTSVFARLADVISNDWRSKAMPAQLPPPGDWSIWLLLAGRAFGKSYASAQHIREIADSGAVSHIAIVGATMAAVRDIQVLGPSGLMSIVPNYSRPVYEPSKSCITWHNGCKLHLLSAEEPERARGFNFGYAWMDELCAWSNAQEMWDMVQMCMRISKRPRTVISTTPKASKLLKSIIAREGIDVAITRGSTYDNRQNLAPGFFASVVAQYEGTRRGRQELMAEVLDDFEGALWTRDMIEKSRIKKGEQPEMQRIVVAIDPAVSVSESSDATGIVVCGKSHQRHGYVLEDLSGKYSPVEWARKAIAAYHAHSADRIVYEQNQGGDMVAHTLRMVDANIPLTAVHASRGKIVRAEPISAIYEQHKVHHVGCFPDLEDEMCSFEPGTKDSPDRLDAMVYALTDLQISGPGPWTIDYNFQFR
jgi:predicted phage terminase large subunit-like protein